MQIVVGPVLTREGGYAFDAWTVEKGFQRGYIYRRIEEAYYARKFELKCREGDRSGHIMACNTVDEFVRSTMTGDTQEKA